MDVADNEQVAKRPRNELPSLVLSEAQTDVISHEPGANMDLSEACQALEDNSTWTQVPTATERAVKRAQRIVERRTNAREASKWTQAEAARDIHQSEGFEVILKPEIEGTSFIGKSLLKIYEDLRAKVSGAQARIDSKGWLVVTVPSLDQAAAIRQLSSVLGVAVTALKTTELALWGRITGVNPAFLESDLLEALAPQGVEKIIREKYVIRELSTNGAASKAERPSNRVRLLFKDKLIPFVTIASERFPVSICPAAPVQCLTCCRFGHKAADCLRKGGAICRKCGLPGHQMWQCTRDSRCVNCQGHHAANDRKCQVYATYAKAAADRYTNRILASIPNARVEIPEQPVSEASADCNKPSFASVVARSVPRIIVQKTLEGDTTICQMPRVPSIKKTPTRTVKSSAANSQEVKTAASLKMNETRPKDSLAEFFGLVKRIWPVLKQLLEPLFKETPWLQKLVDVLTSDAVVELIQARNEESRMKPQDV